MKTWELKVTIMSDTEPDRTDMDATWDVTGAIAARMWPTGAVVNFAMMGLEPLDPPTKGTDVSSWRETPYRTDDEDVEKAGFKRPDP